MSACPHCSADVPPGVRFCPECGGALAIVCPACGATPPPGRFCGSCGAALAGVVGVVASASGTQSVAERRVTSVLFADLVGFTPLSESRDAEDVRELLSRYFDECRMVIGRYGGTVEKFIGDAVMAVWGVPVAHEDDAERAVRAGLELVQAITGLGEAVGEPSLAMRVGVVTGEVAVTLGATAEGMVAGDAVNTAARVQSAAEPGQVWVDELTRSLAGVAITFDDTGEHSLKGKSEPMRLWRAGSVVAEVGGSQRVDGLEAPLAGRNRELRLIKELFHATQEAARPRLVVVDGEAGIGKSRLAWEFEKYADGLRAFIRWHRGRCLSYGDGVAFWALAEAIRARLGLVEADAGQAVVDALDAGLVELVSEPAERDWLRPRLAALLGVGGGSSFAREDLFAAWTAFLEHLAKDQSAVVLVIDDAQYADDGLLDFLDHVLVAARAPIFVLVLTRPELLARRHDLGGRRANVVRLEPLDDAAMAGVVDGLVVGLPTAVRNELVARAEGVPLFAVETIRALIDRDLVIPSEGRYVPVDGILVGLEAIGAPASLHALIAARLDALSPDERHAVAAASVLGQAFTADGIAALVSEPLDLATALEALRRKEFFTLETDRFSGERGQYRFVQSVVRQVAYNTQSKRDRKLRHLAAADYLAGAPDPGDDLAVVMAQHLLDAVDISSATDADVAELTSRACELLERAALRVRALGSPIEAMRLAEAALARAQGPVVLARLELIAADSAWEAGKYPQAIGHAVTATNQYDDLDLPVEAGTAAAIHALTLAFERENTAAIAIAQPRWEALEGVVGADRALLRLANALRLAHQWRGEWEEVGRYAERQLLLAQAVDEPAALCEALISLGVRFTGMGAHVAAQAMMQGGASIAREHDLLGQLARALYNLAAVQVSRDLDAALEYGRESLEVSQRSGVRFSMDYSAVNYLMVLWAAGRLGDAESLLAPTVESVADRNISIGLHLLGLWLADAFGVVPPPRPELTPGDDVSALSWFENVEIWDALAAGDAQRAAAMAEECMAHVLGAYGVDDDFMALWPPLVHAALAAGDTDMAERLISPVLTAGPGTVSPAVRAQLRRLQGLIGAARGDDPVRVESDLRAGIDALAAFGAVGFTAKAREELGRWLLGQDRRADAEPLLDWARETYREIGAVGWLRELDRAVSGSSTSTTLTAR
jgi:class 3 adenylate cyclase/tetratricopeptide (TPR) repeat protein